jgi:hypothetical protein
MVERGARLEEADPAISTIARDGVRYKPCRAKV